MGYKTIQDGQRALIFNDRGEGRVVVGPRRLWLQRGETLQMLPSKVASQSQYLQVKDKEGTIENYPGPCRMYQNPLEHDRIEVKEATKLTADEMLVVYKQENNAVERRLLYGPAVFVPTAHEWLHEFNWHGVDSNDKTRWIPAAHKFHKLSTIPGQMYYNVREVRTNDDVTMRVKLMMFYQLTSADKMLNMTHDPIADFINAVCSDVIAFASQMSYSEFHKETHQLSNLKTYPQLCQRAQRIGYQFTNVVYRGYHASDQFQALQDNAIHTRTKRHLDAEIQEEVAKLEGFKLKKEMERTTQRQAIESAQFAQRQELDKKRQLLQLKQEERQHEAKLKRSAKEREALVTIETAEKQQEVQLLSALRDLGVDMTQYLVSQQPAKISDELQLTREHRRDPIST